MCLVLNCYCKRTVSNGIIGKLKQLIFCTLGEKVMFYGINNYTQDSSYGFASVQKPNQLSRRAGVKFWATANLP